MMITQVKPKRQVKELDRYLKGEIGEAIIQLTELTKVRGSCLGSGTKVRRVKHRMSTQQS